MTAGKLYDGATAFPHPVRVEPAGDELRLLIEGGHSQTVPAALLSRDGDAGDLRFSRSDLPGWRLVLAEAPSAALEALLPMPARYGGFIDRIGLGRAAVALAGVAAVVLVIGYSAPAFLAPHVPHAWERNLGDAIVGDFGANRCKGPEADTVLAALAERVSPGATSGEDAISVAALDLDVVNAAALPGRHVVFFEGMIDKARSGDELAGVMAHEIAHVRRRHVTEALLRELGIGALIRLFAGGVGANAEQLVGLSFTRAHEAEADEDAMRMLAAAGVDPRPTAALFRRLDPRAAEGRRLEVSWLESHPGIKGRADRFDAAARPGTAYRPALSNAELLALRAACTSAKAGD